MKFDPKTFLPEGAIAVKYICSPCRVYFTGGGYCFGGSESESPRTITDDDRRHWEPIIKKELQNKRGQVDVDFEVPGSAIREMHALNRVLIVERLSRGQMSNGLPFLSSMLKGAHRCLLSEQVDSAGNKKREGIEDIVSELCLQFGLLQTQRDEPDDDEFLTDNIHYGFRLALVLDRLRALLSLYYIYKSFLTLLTSDEEHALALLLRSSNDVPAKACYTAADYRKYVSTWSSRIGRTALIEFEGDRDPRTYQVFSSAMDASLGIMLDIIGLGAKAKEKRTTHNCELCGQEFLRKHGRTIYCPDCKQNRNAAVNKHREKKKAEKGAVRGETSKS